MKIAAFQITTFDHAQWHRYGTFEDRTLHDAIILINMPQADNITVFILQYYTAVLYISDSVIIIVQ